MTPQLTIWGLRAATLALIPPKGPAPQPVAITWQPGATQAQKVEITARALSSFSALSHLDDAERAKMAASLWPPLDARHNLNQP